MRPVATDGVAWSVCVYVCLLVTFVIPAKSAEPIEMPSVGLSLVGPRNPVLNGVEIPLREGQFSGLPGPLKSIWSLGLRCTRQKGQFSLS